MPAADESSERICIGFLSSRVVTVEDVACHLQISHEAIWNRLGFVSVCVKCVHKQLAEEHKHKFFDIC